MSDEIKPRRGENGIGYCTKTCPSYDESKTHRCQAGGGYRPLAYVCEPWVKELMRLTTNLVEAGHVLAESVVMDTPEAEEALDIN